MNIQFDYYYGAEAEQFSFYRVPRMLIKDENFKGLSSDAKLLYGLMLDRISLSIKNGWFDDDNRAFIIYTIDNIMEDLGGGKDKAVKVVAELDQKKGIGLIEKVRRGLGKPDIIYVKNFIVSKEEATKTDVFTEVGKTEFKKLEKPNTRGRESRYQEFDKREFKKPFAYEKELQEKLARQLELNAQLDLENGKVADADLGGLNESKDSHDSNVAEREEDYRTNYDGKRR